MTQIKGTIDLLGDGNVVTARALPPCHLAEIPASRPVKDAGPHHVLRSTAVTESNVMLLVHVRYENNHWLVGLQDSESGSSNPGSSNWFVGRKAGEADELTQLRHWKEAEAAASEA